MTDATDPKDAPDAPAEPGFLAGLSSDNATLLLAAAQELELDPSVIGVDSERGGFIAPAEVIAKAGGDGKDNQSKRSKTSGADETAGPSAPEDSKQAKE